MNQEKVGRFIRELRIEKEMTQQELAEKLGVTDSAISKWENGQAVPELNGLILLSELYGVTIDRIVKENDECKEINHMIQFR